MRAVLTHKCSDDPGFDALVAAFEEEEEEDEDAYDEYGNEKDVRKLLYVHLRILSPKNAQRFNMEPGHKENEFRDESDAEGEGKRG